MLAAKTIFRPAEYLRDVAKVIDFLDETNVKILSTIRKIGPRNLLEVARRARLPFSTTYSRYHSLKRITKGALATVIPNFSRFGLMRCEVLVEAMQGNEEDVNRALKIPNYWTLMFTSEGIFTHFSVQAIPAEHMVDFTKYLDALKRIGIIRRYETFRTGEYFPIFPVFDGFDAERGRWEFAWKSWIRAITRGTIARVIRDPESYEIRADKTDLFIIKELQKDGAKKYAEIAKMLGVTLQAVKYRFDRNIVGKQLIHDFSIRVVPYPPSLADLREVKVDFKNKRAMDRFFSNAPKISFIWGVSKILGQSSLLVRTYTPRSESTNLFRFFSDLVKRGGVASYSSLRLNFEEMEDQTISYELYDNKMGWPFSLENYLKQLRNLRIAS